MPKMKIPKQEDYRSSNTAGISESDDVTLSKMNSQKQQKPNGCGLFCYHTIQLHPNAGQDDPATTPHKFMKILTLPVEEKHTPKPGDKYMNTVSSNERVL